MSDTTDASLGNEGNNGTTQTVEPTEKPTWIEQVKGDLQGSEILGKFSTVTDAAQRLVDLEGSAADSITKLGENATDKDRDVFYNAIGRPESSDKYEFALPEGMSDELKPNDDALGELKTDFHKWGLTQTQGQSVMDKLNTLIMDGSAKMIAAAETQAKDAKEALGKDWGDDLKVNTEKAERVISRFGGDDFRTFLKEVGLENSPEFIRFTHHLSTVLSEDSMMEPSEQGTSKAKRSASGGPMLDFKGM